jgi:hypothetical protein
MGLIRFFVENILLFCRNIKTKSTISQHPSHHLFLILMKKRNFTLKMLLPIVLVVAITGRLSAQLPNVLKKERANGVRKEYLKNLSEKTRLRVEKWTAGQRIPQVGKAKSFAHALFQNARVSSEAAPAPPTSTVLYVNQNASGANNGTDWTNAYIELADALFFAKNNVSVRQIWVASGTYKPLYRPDTYIKSLSDRDNAFVLVPDVKIYGGFFGDEATVEERDLRNVNAVVLGMEGGFGSTILSGDFNGDDNADFINHGENAYHVVLSLGEVGAAELDGVTIAHSGKPELESTLSVGGSYVIQRSSGGAIALYNSSPRFTNLIIRQNLQQTGAAIYASGSPFVLTNSIISGNKALGNSTVQLNASSPFITNVTIAQNTAADFAGGIGAFAGSAPQIRNTIVYGNTAAANPDVKVDNSSPVYSSCIIKGSGGSVTWTNTFGTDAGNNLDTDPGFYDAANQIYGLSPTSPAINTGDNTFFGAAQTPDLSTVSTDIRGTTRIMKLQVDIGAFESPYAVLSSDLVPTAGRIYVRKGGTGSKNGGSWDHAAAEVADALLAARLNPQIQEIWVAGGIYHPLYDPENLSDENPEQRLNAFVMVPDVKLYGGFAGDEIALDQRDLSIKANASILSADFDKNDQFDIMNPSEEGFLSIQENAFHLMYMVGEMGEAVMDGFSIEGAGLLSLMLSENEDLDYLGEKVLLINESSIPFIIGGGVTTIGSSVHFSNLIVRNNLSIYGAGLTSFGGDQLVTNSLFHGNVGFILGSGVTGFLTGMNIINTTVADNLTGTGAGVALQGGVSTFANSICYANFDSDGVQLNILAFADEESDDEPLTVISSLVGESGGSTDWYLDFAIDGGGNLDEDPLFNDLAAGDFSLISCSNAINAGTNDFYEGSAVPDLSLITKDLAGNVRILLETVDIGAYEFNGDPETAIKPLARDGNELSYSFVNNNAYTFTAPSGNCILDILTLKPGTLTGNVTSRVWKDNVVNTFNGATYLQRHYDIEPENEPGSATGLVTLYFTQGEFDAFNTKVGASEFLPTGNPVGETERKANLRIYQFHGTSSDGSGNPSTYSSGSSVIQPREEDIFWNSTLLRWEVTFEVTGFSGFFAGTQSQSLPVRLVSFEGSLTDDQKVELNWVVAEQENIQAYAVEYSANGKVFSEIGVKPANFLSSTKYSYVDTLNHSGVHAYYRLRIMEMDGKKAYSKLVSVKLPERRKMIVYPVPAKNQVWLQWKESNMTSAEIINKEGKVVKKISRSGETQLIDISVFPAGMYFLRPQGSAAIKLIKE